jgi:hypothetical protein
MEEIDGRAKYLERVELPFAAVPAARRFLELAGLNHFGLFGDLPSLSRHLIEKNKLTLAKRKPHKRRR